MESEASRPPQVTQVVYHVDDEDLPILVKLEVPPDKVTLADLKAKVKRSNCKYFFKSKDVDFGVVKEEITDDSSPLPLFNGKVVCYLEQTAKHGHEVDRLPGNVETSSRASASATSDSVALPPPGLERGPGVGETRPPSFHGGVNNREDLAYTESESALTSQREIEDDFEDTESSITSVSQAAEERRRQMEMRLRYGHHRSSKPARLPGPGIRPPGRAHSSVSNQESSSMLSSEIESSIYDDTEDGMSMASSRFTTSTDHTSVSQQALKNRQKKRSKRRVPAHLNRAGSISSITDSTTSINCITVILNMDKVSFLGISIVGQSNTAGDGDYGIYVGSIMKGGAVAKDGRIEPGDMILQVNDISFENMSNDDAVRVLREVVQKPGPIKLVVAKCWDRSPSRSYFTVPRTEPVRPIDPGAWVAHTAAVRGEAIPPYAESYIDGPFETSRDFLLGELPLGSSHFVPNQAFGDYSGRCESVTTLSATSIVSSEAETERYVPLTNEPLTTQSGMGQIVRAMQRQDSELEIRDRTWCKITIKKAFLGSDLVDWLFKNVQGFSDKREAKKFAGQMLKAKFINSGVNKATFSEQSYFTFGDEQTISSGLANVNLSRNDAGTKPRVPPPTGPAPPIPWSPPTVTNTEQGPAWAGVQPHQMTDQSGMSIYNPSAPPPSANYMQMPYSSAIPAHIPTVFNGQRSVVSSGGGSGNSFTGSQPHLRLAGSGSGSESTESRSGGTVKGINMTQGMATTSVASSDGGFLSSLVTRTQATQGIVSANHPQTAYQAHC